MLWLFSLLGTLAGILLGAVLLIAWVLLKEIARGLVWLASAVIRGVRHPQDRSKSALEMAANDEIMEGSAQVYSLDERRKTREP